MTYSLSKNIVIACSILTLLIFIPLFNVSAQEIDLEELLESEEEGEDQSDLVEYLHFLVQNPLDLNTVSSQELQTIPWIKPTLARRIIAYRTKHSSFSDTKELLRVKGMDEDTYNIIRHFLCVYKQKAPTRIHFASRHRLSTRIEDPYGYQQKIYAGSKEKHYNRAVIGINDFADAGLLLEKDAGENRFDDLTLNYIKLQIHALNTEILVGNYKFEAGQGLVFWGPYGFGKSNNAVAPVKKRSRGLREYLSVDENAGFKGAAVSTQFRWLNITGLYSRTLLDATLSDEGKITSIYSSGYHRTESEQSKKDAALETLYGCRASFNIVKSRFGVTVQDAQYDPGFEPATPNKWMSWQDTHNRVAGADFNVVVGRTNIFGELAQSKSGGRALYSGMIVDYGSFDLALSVRRYDHNYTSPHSFAFGERNGRGQNEHGYYFGVRGKILPATRVSFYFDQFKSPYPTTRNPMPAHGWDSVCYLEQKLARKLSLSAKIRVKNKEQAYSLEDEYGRNETKLVFQRRITARTQLLCTLVKNLILRSRIEKVWLQWDDLDARINVQPPSQGVLLYQDVRLELSKRIRLNWRLAFFDTDNYDARLYQYEAAMPGMWSSRMLYGKGTRWYILARINLIHWLKVHAKYSSTIYDDRDSIGSGLEKIESATDRRFDLQLDWKLN